MRRGARTAWTWRAFFLRPDNPERLSTAAGPVSSASCTQSCNRPGAGCHGSPPPGGPNVPPSRHSSLAFNRAPDQIVSGQPGLTSKGENPMVGRGYDLELGLHLFDPASGMPQPEPDARPLPHPRSRGGRPPHRRRVVMGAIAVLGACLVAWGAQSELLLVTSMHNGEFAVSSHSLREDD